MIELYITAEGPSELNFAQKVLAPHLKKFNVFVDVRSVLTSEDTRTAKAHRGGLFRYTHAQKDIYAWCKEKHRPKCRFTTMFDLYALPRGFPGYEEAKKAAPYERVKILEDKMAQSIKDSRFIPYIQLHEFESLIFAAPQYLACEYLRRDAAINKLIVMAGDTNPELINDGPKSAPSKRIIKEIPEYKHSKHTLGVAVVKAIGLPTLRAKCTHFNEWLTGLEQLAGVSP